MESIFAILTFAVSLTVPLSIFVINSLVDARIKQQISSEFKVIRTQIAQLQHRVAILQTKVGDDPETFIPS